MARTRSTRFDVGFRCSCGGEHVAHGTAELLRQPISFGGGGQAPAATAATWAGPVMCPRQHQLVEGQLLIPAEYNESVRRVEIESVTDGAGDGATGGNGAAPAEQEAPAPTDWVDEELRDWRKSTVDTQRTYATTMLTTSSGSVAVYFAVLKYLGWDQAHLGSGLVGLTVAAPVLLFAAAAAFALALRPSLTFVERSEYAEFRARRIDQMHRRSTIGTILYVAALVLAVVVFVAVLEAVS